MASRKKLTIHYSSEQKYSCRDCPARCCTSWSIPVTREEFKRITADDEALLRLGVKGVPILGKGVMPMREEGKRLACVFLDEDQLCSLHKRKGHEFLPAACRSYPFGFSKNEKQEPVALLSRYCPSIRDNYGESIAGLVENKWKEAAQPASMAEGLGLRSGRVLPRAQYVQLVKHWITILRRSESAPQALSEIFDFTEAVDAALPASKKPSDQEFTLLLKTADEQKVSSLSAQPLGFNGRVLLSHLLGSICYPTRVIAEHRLSSVSVIQKLRALWTRVSWLMEWGRVSLLFIQKPVAVKKIKGVQSFVATPVGRLLSDFLVEVLERRQSFVKKTYLQRSLIELALMTTVISRYARAAAVAEGKQEVSEAGVKEGIGIAELLFSHQGDSAQGLVLGQLQMKLMSNPEEYRQLLAAEL